MTHHQIWEIFKKLFPLYAEASTEWFTNGKGSIRVRLLNPRQDFVFTYINNKEWKFETIDSYLKTLKKK